MCGKWAWVRRIGSPCRFPAQSEDGCHLLLALVFSLEVGVMGNWGHGERLCVGSGVGFGELGPHVQVSTSVRVRLPSSFDTGLFLKQLGAARNSQKQPGAARSSGEQPGAARKQPGSATSS